MDYIDKYSFERYVDAAFDLDPAERNQMYHKIMELIEEDDCESASGNIVEMFVQFLDNRKNDLEVKAVEKREGDEPGAVFRRVG